MSSAQSPEHASVDVIWLATLPATSRQPYGELIPSLRDPDQRCVSKLVDLRAEGLKRDQHRVPR
jgi:hypothetical protein